VKPENGTHNLSNELNQRITWSQARIVVFAAFICALCGGYAAAQDVNTETADQQTNSGSQPGTPPPCYLGGTGTTPSPGGDNSQMPTAAGPGWGTQESDSDYPQQENDAQEGEQYPSDQTDMGQASHQPTMSAEQIIAILQQSPDARGTFKDLAGLQYGVDPSTISDNGVYNCIRQDANFRSQVAKELVNQGYVANPEQNNEQGYGANPEQKNEGTTAREGALATNRQGRQLPSARGIPPVQVRPPEQPSEVRKLTSIPYRNIPSLRDLYSQEVPGNGNLRRFGSDAFLFGTGNANELPMDLPVGPDYVLGPGDNLIVNMWGGQSARLSRTVDRQGQIALPEAGTVTIAGLTVAEAQSAIQNALGTQFQNEHVEISLGRVRTVRVYVVGDVQRPGAYDLSSLSTPLNALYAAGGPTSRGSLRTLKQYRGKELVQEIDLYDFLLHGVRTSVDRLLPGDTILVPPVGPQVSVAGMVRRPAVYELKGEASIDDVLNLAGGVLVSADLKEVRVERVVAHERHTMLSVQIPDSSKGEATKLPAFQVQDGDFIRVSPILPYNDQAVYLDGHVYKPGRYAWRDGMTVNDLLHSYQDVMPEPANHAEIIRLVPPDLQPKNIGFNLPDVLIGNDPIPLQPFDTVRVFGRYEIDPPRVSIFGDVLRPGDYPMSQGMTVTGLVNMAGGFRRSAYRQEADLSSYAVRDGEKVLIGHRVVEVQKALDGDKSADVLLKPGDVVGIRQLAGWNDIGASITVEGEVSHEGTYGIDEGERLSSVLKRAGGFREDAYPQGAVLERVQVRQLEEKNRQEMIRRIESSVPTVSPGVSTTSQDQQSLLQTMLQQRQEVLAALRNHPSTGRIVIEISADISKWENTPADIIVRAGDRLTVPKRPDFVLVSGQVYNATGITYRPGRDAGWYLHQAGGATRSGDMRSVFILRADGSVVSGGKSTIFSPGILSLHMHPGDSIIVPEKVIGGSQLWRNLIGTAQIMASVAFTGAVAGAW
jgi:protein involved in polysaccharide export with SLBB domain